MSIDQPFFGRLSLPAVFFRQLSREEEVHESCVTGIFDLAVNRPFWQTVELRTNCVDASRWEIAA